jgi:hypothetical protein
MEKAYFGIVEYYENIIYFSIFDKWKFVKNIAIIYEILFLGVLKIMEMLLNFLTL